MVLCAPPACLNAAGPGLSFGPEAVRRWLPLHEVALWRGAPQGPAAAEVLNIVLISLYVFQVTVPKIRWRLGHSLPERTLHSVIGEIVLYAEV